MRHTHLRRPSERPNRKRSELHRLPRQPNVRHSSLTTPPSPLKPPSPAARQARAAHSQTPSPKTTARRNRGDPDRRPNTSTKTMECGANTHPDERTHLRMNTPATPTAQSTQAQPQAPRTPSPRPRKRTPAAQPDEHPTPSKTKKARPSRLLQPAASPSPQDSTWTVVTHKKKARHSTRMNENNIIGPMTTIYGSPEAPPTQLPVPQAATTADQVPAPPAIPPPLSPETTEDIRLFQEAEETQREEWRNEMREDLYPFMEPDERRRQEEEDRQTSRARSGEIAPNAIDFPPLPPRPSVPTDTADTPRLPLSIQGTRIPRINSQRPTNAPTPPQQPAHPAREENDIQMAAPTDHVATASPHPILQPSTISNGRRTLSNGLVITEAPEGGKWPERFSFEHCLKGIDPGQRAVWLAKPQPTIIATAWRQKFGDNAKLAASLVNLLPRIIDAPDVLVSTPFRPEGDVFPPNGFKGPYGLLISNISDDCAELLLNLGVIITAGAIFFFQPVDTPNSKFIGTLEGFTVPDGGRGAEQVREILRNCLRMNNTALNFIRRWTPDSLEDEANKMIASITIEPIMIRTREGPTKTVWNTYCVPPPLPHHLYQEWIGIIRDLRPSDYDAGRGHFRNEKPFQCMGCRSINHPTGLCPLPLITGWLGPAASSELPEDATALDNDPPVGSTRGHTRGNRGRGGVARRPGNHRAGRGNARHLKHPDNSRAQQLPPPEEHATDKSPLYLTGDKHGLTAQ
ncbi:hypothetical protein HYPSUDRAFT_198682 [Hypholoma sublateritium FD-334 SS-4]|uniref:Uncharacterized protein n=1 Tax=Hypholoma sublateritium (strain FD-334 SS-4) TaxID=945553 RepID=A0A0D2MSC8_HYPSF|nr:hypothetical protein HYPSUDRAFT_198682 [Hypholoma sublateritium FD-334 SS-4]